MNTEPGAVPKTFGPFDVLDILGRGGHASVYKVRHRVTGQVAALKVGLSTLKLEAGALERFEMEFKEIFPLRHPSIVRALALGEQDGVPYLVLEYVPGQTLEQWVQQKGALQETEAIAVFRQVADGLRHLHAHHILHRDIKPSNILWTTYDQAKLADFGLLKKLTDDQQLTASRKSMGTIDYGAPEQFEDAKHVDRRCDLYSLAASLYTALTGKFPFGIGNHMQILQRKLLGHFVPLRLLLPTLDPAVDELVSRCLNACPLQRPRSCEEFIAVLQQSATRRVPAQVAVDDVPRGDGQPKSGAERRATVRFAVELTATFVPFHQNMRGRWQASILDVSSGGVCLETPRPVAVNSVLQVTLGQGAGSELALVRWVKPGPAATHIVGCAFVRPLPRELVEAVRQSGLAVTNTREPQGVTTSHE